MVFEVAALVGCCVYIVSPVVESINKVCKWP